MEGVGLKVRCLASTRISEQEIGQSEGLEIYRHGAKRAETVLSYKRDREKQEGNAEAEENHDESDTASSSSISSPESSDSAESSDDHDSSTTPTQDLETQPTSCIQEAQLSPDGTCIFTSDYDRAFSVYPLNANTPSDSTRQTLKPYAQFRSSNPIWSYTVNPLFNYQDASTTHVLVSRRDSYITLHNALWDISRDYSSTSDSQQALPSPVDISKPLASYRLINSLTEAVTAPSSLAYSNDGLYFFAGHQNAIATFDLQHTSHPIHTTATIPSTRSKRKGGGRGFKGLISALSLSPPSSPSSSHGLLAAGSRTRNVGIYDAISGEEITHFSLPGSINGRKMRNKDLANIIGDGVTQLKWSPCGKYLYIAERDSSALLIYDVRNFALSLAHCAGRNALTKQKLGFDIWNAGNSTHDIEAVVSHEVWAGGIDGMIRVWRDPWSKEGAVQPDDVVQVNEGNVPVVSALVHRSGNLAVAASGVLQVDDGGEKKALLPGMKRRGGVIQPIYREWGSLDIFGLG